MTVPKLRSTLPEGQTDLCCRISNQPLIRPSDVVPSDPRLSVIGVFNPAFIFLDGRPSLIVRVDERPILQARPEPGQAFKMIDVAYLNEEHSETIDIVQIEVPVSFDPDKESFLPDTARKAHHRASKAALYLAFVSHLRVGRITDNGISLSSTPAIFPSDKFSQYGCEDPRAVILDGTPLVTFGAIGRFGATGWVATLLEDGSIQSKSMLLGPDHKHCALFPLRINDKYFMATRPLTRSTILQEGVWILCSPDLQNWGMPTPLLHPRPMMWDSVRVGPGPSPILLPKGWLLLYYGVDRDHSYHLGAALLDPSDPTRVIARSVDPILSPVLPWERSGRRADTIFACGAQLLPNNETIRIFYGASDMYVGAADLSLAILERALIPQ